MCGLVGVINKASNGFTAQQRDVFTDLLFLDYLRGPDSTGVFLVTNDGDVSIRKAATDPIDFMRKEEFAEVHKKAFSVGSALIGHNRKATRGVINDANAHPFVVDDDIVLVHNGTLFGDHKKLADVEVDSEAIAKVIHEKGNVEEAMKTIDGAYALIWYEFKNRRLNFLRNDMRPLWTFETLDSYVWASEKAMLEFVIDRHNLKTTTAPFQLKVDSLQTFTLTQHGVWETGTQQLELAVPQTKEERERQEIMWQTWLAERGEGNPDDFGDRIPLARRIPSANTGRAPIIDMCTWPRNDELRERAKLRLRGHRIDADALLDVDEPPFDGGTKREETGVIPVDLSVPRPGTTPFWELEFARTNNLVITHSEYQREVLHSYHFGQKIICVTKDYCYANQKDPKGGYYLYSVVADDPDVIVRMFMDSKYIDEERMIQIAGTEYIYEFTIARRRWNAFSPGDLHERTPGYCVIDADKASLKYGGGVGDKSWQRLIHSTVH